MLIIDAQSVKNTETAHLKGYDGGKKISGIKRHIAVDTQGLPHANHVTAANVSDQAGGIKMFQKSEDKRVGNVLLTENESAIKEQVITTERGVKKSKPGKKTSTKNAKEGNSIQTILADGGYVGEPFQNAIRASLGAQVKIAKRSKLHTFKVIPQRWIVERSFSWLEKCRRLWKNCERLASSSLAMIMLAFIRLILKRS